MSEKRTNANEGANLLTKAEIFAALALPAILISDPAASFVTVCQRAHRCGIELSRLFDGHE